MIGVPAADYTRDELRFLSPRGRESFYTTYMYNAGRVFDAQKNKSSCGYAMGSKLHEMHRDLFNNSHYSAREITERT